MRKQLGVWEFRHFASKLLFYVDKLKLSYDAAFQRAIKSLSVSASKRLLYYAGRDFVSRYYTLAYLAEKAYGRYWHKKKERRLADLWIYYFGRDYIERHELRRFSKKIARNAPRGKLPDLEDAIGELSGIDEISVKLSYPRWLVAELAGILGEEETERMLEALNREVVWLRVNLARTDVDRALEALRAEGVKAEKHQKLEYMVRVVSSPKPVANLKAVRAGYVTPQDLGSALVAEELEDGLLFDACSAPGGKLAIFLVRRRGYGLGCDLSAKRLVSEARILASSGVPMHRLSLVRCDAASFSLRRKADQVLLDAPCSGSGTVRRNPAVKIALQRRSRIEYYVSLQKRLLKKALENSAKLIVYSTCSIIPEEGELVVQNLRLLESKAGLPAGYWGVGYRVYPHIHDAEGFFVARLAPV